MKCYVCHTTRPLAGGLWSTAHEAVAICHHCGAGVCAEHAHRAEAPGSPIYCEECFAVVMAEANLAAPDPAAPAVVAPASAPSRAAALAGAA